MSATITAGTSIALDTVYHFSTSLALDVTGPEVRAEIAQEYGVEVGADFSYSTQRAWEEVGDEYLAGGTPQHPTQFNVVDYIADTYGENFVFDGWDSAPPQQHSLINNVGGPEIKTTENLPYVEFEEQDSKWGWSTGFWVKEI